MNAKRDNNPSQRPLAVCLLLVLLNTTSQRHLFGSGTELVSGSDYTQYNSVQAQRQMQNRISPTRKTNPRMVSSFCSRVFTLAKFSIPYYCFLTSQQLTCTRFHPYTFLRR